MARVSAEITDSALNDFCRFFGLPLGEAARSELAAEFEQARFVKVREGAEIWRGRRPRRVQFIVFPQTDGRLVVASITPPFRGAVVKPIERDVQLQTDDGVVSFKAVDMVLERGMERRVAYKSSAGTWLAGRRGARLDEVVGGLMETREPPDWVLPYMKA